MKTPKRMGRKKCAACGKQIYWLKTASGITVPLDPEPVLILPDIRGNTYIRRDGGYVFGRKVDDSFENDDPDTNLVKAYESHYSTCTAGGRVRNRKPRNRPKGFR